MAGPPLISFIVPTLDEEEFLEGLIATIRDHCPVKIPHEVIVVDNGSSDRTVEVAGTSGATVLVRPDGTVGHLRNEGGRAARGQVLVFLDADIRLSPSWSKNIGQVVARMLARPRTISGSACHAPPDSGWVARAWSDFSFRNRKRPTHIGTGHLIVRRQAFLELKGFDPALETGEDFEFCRRAVAEGFDLEPDSSLFVTHARLPSTVREFMRREVWHGSGDSTDLGSLVTSRIAVTSLLFVAFHVTLLPWVWWAPPRLRVIGILVVILGLLGLCVGAAIRRGGAGSLRLLVQRTALFYLYFWSRFVAVCRGVSRRALGNTGRAGKARGW